MSTNSYESGAALDWIARRNRDELAALPPAKYKETIERARRLAQEKPRSYLGKHLAALYGVSQ